MSIEHTIRRVGAASLLALALSAIFAHAAPAPAQRAKAEAFIAGAGGQALWTIDDKGDIHHVQSGLKCPLPEPDDRIQLVNLHAYESAELGGDVSCELVHTDGDKKIYLTLYAFRPQGRSDKDWLDIAISSAKTVHPTWTLDGKPEMTLSITAPGKSEPAIEPLTAAFSYKEGDVPMRSSVWVASTHGWVVQARATYRLDQKGPGETLAVVFWAGAVEDIQRQGAK